MKIRYKIVLLSFFVSFLSGAQEEDITNNLKDSIRINIYSNPNKAIKFLHQYVKISEKNNNTPNVIKANSALAAAHEVSNEIDSTLYYHYKNLSIVQEPIDIVNTKYSIARVFEQQDRYKEALRSYQQALDLANTNNLEEASNNIIISIETLKNKIGQSKNDLELLKSDYSSKLNSRDLNLRFTRKTLIEAYIKNENYEEASTLLDVGLKEAEEDGDCEFIYYMNSLKSIIHIQRGELSLALKDCKYALDCAIDLNNQGFVNEVKFREAEIAFLSTDFKKAIENLEFIHQNNTVKSTKQLTKYYKLTADTYKKLGRTELSSDFYSKYITEKEKLSTLQFSNLETLYNLNMNERVSEFENVLEQAKIKSATQNKTKKYLIYLSFGLIVIVLTLIVFFKNKSKTEQKKFMELIIKIDEFEKRKTDEKLSIRHNVKTDDVIIGSQPELEAETEIDEENNTEEISTSVSLDQEDEEIVETVYVIDDERIEEILMKLQKLEDKLYFLRQDCTLHNMAKRLKTNTSYLSKIINTHLDKSFSLYINELRINYAILELKHNKRLRAYSVKGIAQEIGYKNADSFSRYFKAATGISPSVYIKKIEENKIN